MATRLAAVLVSLLCSLCLGRRIIDLSHTLDKDAPEYPTGGELGPDMTYYKIQLAGVDFKVGTEELWVEIGKLQFYEHIGTHMDAPKHFGKGRQSMAEIPIERLVGPGVVINVKEKARNDSNYGVTLNDVLEYEEKYGRIPPGAIVMMNSGWSSFYTNLELYFGSKTPKDVTTQNFPGFGLDACEFLLRERQVSVVGVDTISVDPGRSKRVYGWPYPCHNHLQPNNVPLLENIANLDSIPPKGTTIFLGGLKTRTGTGGPTRIFAVIDDDMKDISNSAEMSFNPWLSLLMSMIAAKIVLQ